MPDFDELMTALRQPGVLSPDRTQTVETRETHISGLFFVGDRVFKIKKPLRLGFLDFSTLARRRHFCEEEVRLNRRLAPDVYRGVVEIRRTAGGEIRLDGEGTVVEYAVEMMRLPAEGMLDDRLVRGVIDAAAIDAIAERVVRFHAEAATGVGVDEHGTPDAVRARVFRNVDELGPFIAATPSFVPPRVLGPDLAAHLRRWLDDTFARNASALAERVRTGRIRDGHGDLHAGNICLTGGEVVAYDCIEFEPSFRCLDVAAEVAFLAMDLDARGYRGFGRDLVRRYAERAGDEGLASLIPLYKTHFALVRAKVAGLRAAETDNSDDGRAAMDLIHLAAAYSVPMPLILMCGLPGSGKSRAAAAIARPFEATVIQSDRVRKSLAGLAATERGSEEIYTASFTTRTYAALAERAATAIDAGRPVVVDATFSTAAHRASFLELARRRGRSALVVEITAPELDATRWLRERGRTAGAVSDADTKVRRRLADRFEPPEEVPARARLRLVSPREPAWAARAVLERLAALRPPRDAS